MPLSLRRGGRFADDHALAILLEIAELGAQTGIKLKVPESWSCSNPIKAASAYWVRKSWKQEVSGWLEVTLSDTLLRQTSRASICIWVLDLGRIPYRSLTKRLHTPTGLFHSI